ncbi:MAG: hypothetical protein DHS20C17_06680 [Cyclobacteriaceae bacterium]|nr:MAG: hypothetical protein DHS20C17_06680 [Cyclobacteriaceae bacterium]
MVSNTPPSSELTERSSITGLIEGFDRYSGSIDQVSTQDGLIQLILSEFADLIRNCISIADLEFDKIKDRPVGQNKEIPESYLLHYRLPEHLKSISLLHRDVLLQLIISRCKQFESQLNPDIANKHFLKSKEVLSAAIGSFVQLAIEEQKLLSQTGRPNYRKSLNQIKHQQNPWEVYRKQFHTILDQMEEIDRSGVTVNQLVDSFQSLRTYISSLNKQVIDNLVDSKWLIEQGIDRLKNIEEIKDVNQQITWIEKILEDRQSNGDDQKNFVSQVESKTKNLENLDIPISTHDGNLVKRKVELGKVTSKWLEYVLLPLLIDLWESKESLESYLDHNLINLKSGLMLANNNQSLDSIKSQIKFLQNVATNVEENIEKQREATKRIEELANESLIATRIYQEEDFLEVSLQSSFAQYTTVKNTLLVRLKKKLNNLFIDLGSKYEEANLFNSQKKLETSIECIGYRMFKESNTSYDSLFRNKIFIGDLFLVVREEEEGMLTQSLKLWEAGFNQSALLVGNHLSGKTTFIEYIAKKHFGRQVIKLEVASTFSVEGRKFQTNYNLGEALKFIKNNLYQSKPLIIIDDIEIWRSEEHSLLDNVRAVIKYIESESDNAYVMVSISKPMQDHLDNRLSLSNSFSTVIYLNKSTSEEILEAVLLRHGASHKNLITPDQQTLSPKQIERKVKELCRFLNHNMGKVLQAWTYSSTVVDDQNVLFEEKDYTFRDFFTNEEIIVLKYVALYKHINEIDLKNFLGSKNEAYLSGLKRLVNTKVLLRGEDGELRLNTVIYHDVIDILKYRGILT